MTKDEYLSSLRNLLETNNIPNVDNIINQYNERFNIGYKALLTDDEIIERLGDINDILKKYQENNSKILYDIEVSTALIVDFSIEYTDDDNINIDVSEDLKEKIDINTTNNKIVIKNKLYSNFLKRNSGELKIKIGKNVELDNVKLSFTATDIKISDLACQHLLLRITSGDAVINSLKACDININTVSGDVEIKKLTCDELVCNSVSGDISINNVISKNAKVSSISGDVYLHGHIDKRSFSVISGDLIYKEFN